MTFSTLGTDGTLIEQPDPRTGKNKPVFIPTLEPTRNTIPIQINKTVRPQGLYIVGRQGTGKSGLLENLIIQDIRQGLGVCVVDPHHQGGIIDNIIARLPGREKDVILLDIRDNKYPFGLNLFACSDPTDDLEVQEVVDRVLHVFDKLLGVTPETPLIRQYLRNCTYTLVENPGYTMSDILLLLIDKNFRQKLIANVTNANVLNFWKQYEALSPNVQEERSSSLQRRVEEFLQPLTINIVGQEKSTIDFRAIMDDQKILLVKLDSLRLSSVTNLIGSLFLAAFLTAAPTRTRKQNIFNIYADEFQNFATEDFVKLIEEARKFGIGITIAHQNRAQLELSNKQAEIELKKRVLNVGSLIVFCVPTDAQELAGQFDTTPPPAEIRTDYKRTIVRKPVDYYLSSGRSHPVEAVSRFFSLWRDRHNKKEDTKIDVNLNPHFSGDVHKSLRSSAFNYRRVSMHFLNGSWELPNAYEEMEQINSYFYEMMRTKNPFAVFPLKLFYTALLQLKPACFDIDGFYLFHNNDRVEHHSKYEPRDYVSYVFRLFGEQITDGYGNIKPRSPSVHLGNFRNVYDALWLAKNEQQLQSAFTNYEQAVCRSLRIDLLFALKNILIRKNADGVCFLVTREYTGLSVPRGSAAYEKQKQERFLDELRHRLEFSELSSLTDMVVPLLPFEKIKWRIKEDKVQDWYNLEDFDETMLLPAIEKEIDNIVSCCKPSFEQIVRDIRDVCQAIVTHPIEDISGVIEESPGIQLSSDEMRNRIANKLVDLPDYVARVKIKGDTEHIIQTLDPKKQADKPLYGQLLDDRIERIKLHNRTAGYTRPRQDVEAEIRTRQDALRHAAQPQVREVPQLQQRQRRIPLQPAASDSQLEQELEALHNQLLRKGLTSLNFKEWREHEEQKLLRDWLKKQKEAQ